MLSASLNKTFPSFLQIDIPADCQSRTLKGANRYIQGKEMASSIFDEAQFAVFKELLPYWAGFRKNTRIPSDKRIPGQSNKCSIINCVVVIFCCYFFFFSYSNYYYCYFFFFIIFFFIIISSIISIISIIIITSSSLFLVLLFVIVDVLIYFI